MFYADLHVHSKFSRATSRDCDLEHLALWAARKGIAVVGTGDFTHPAWLAEIAGRLVPAEPGLFRLGREPEEAPGVRFMLQVEISTIYKRDGRTRKVHHLVYVPTLEAARRFAESLARIGNVASDGRPILGLDSRDLLEIALESGDGAYLVPAHVWTPWFSVLGSKSGFDSIEECYGELSGEIFALETGLSSDPAMNWCVSSLDRYALVSNSDAHSPPKLGREACVFDTAMDYFAMRRALQTGEGYQGTVEFFPEEGKYHLDGHRKCGVCLEPSQTRHLGGNCPECGKPLTLGVMYRVCELADRDGPPEPLPPRAAPFRSLIPLDEVLAELCGVGPQSKTVRQRYDELLRRVGPELFLLQEAPTEQIAQAGWPLVAEAIGRMRAGRVIRQAGYDGEYGTIRLFTQDELRRQSTVGLLFDDETAEPRGLSPRIAPGIPQRRDEPGGSASQTSEIRETSEVLKTSEVCPAETGILDQLDADQRAAAEAVEGPVLIVAGPGTGKTRTLTHRLAHLIARCGAGAEQCLALAFSRRAAGEMVQRLARLLPEQGRRVPVMTFHALGLSLLREHGARLGQPESVRVAGELERAQLLEQSLGVSEHAAGRLLRAISQRKRRQCGGEPAESQPPPGRLPKSSRLRKSGEHSSADPENPEDARAFDAYAREMKTRGWVDFDDLIALPVALLGAHPDLVEHYRSRYRWVSVDEYQDIDAAQYRLLRLLVAPDGNLCTIGDPDQAIYGFRGADVGYFQRFGEDFPSARTVCLGRNYRSSQAIVEAALQLMAPASLVADRCLAADGAGPEQIEIHACATERAAAEFVVHTIERLLGGSTFFSLDSCRATGHEDQAYSFSDIAVLYRTESQAEALAEALERSGMPFQRRSHNLLADNPTVQAIARAMAEEHARGAAGASVPELLERVAPGVEQEGAPCQALLAALGRLASGCEDVPQLLSELALGVDVDLWDARADRVSLLTLHAAKGLEFPVVFIVGCEDGLLPLHWGKPDAETLAEERRLFFVGMTRARERLVLSHARKRKLRGKVQETAPSPFLADVESRLLARHLHRHKKKAAAVDRQRNLFEA